MREEVLNAVTVQDDSFANLVAYLLLYSMDHPASKVIFTIRYSRLLGPYR